MHRPVAPAAALGALVALMALMTLAAPAANSAPIQDNSFLVEEAYNQESRVVQHIVTWERQRGGAAWEGSFTQEWPFRGQRHQVSYTVAAQQLADGARGLADLALHYRYQCLGVGGGSVAMAPRVSAVLPTGNPERGLGAGAPGLEINLPVSVTLSPRWVTHFNVGGGWLDASDRVTDPAPPRRAVRLAQSLIWLPAPTLNLVTELVWERADIPGETGSAEESFLLAPGVRWAHDFASGLQIVPGLVVPIGLGPSEGERSLFLYLSFEHGF